MAQVASHRLPLKRRRKFFVDAIANLNHAQPSPVTAQFTHSATPRNAQMKRKCANTFETGADGLAEGDLHLMPSSDGGAANVAKLVHKLRAEGDRLTNRGEYLTAAKVYARALRLLRTTMGESSLRASVFHNRAVALLRMGWLEEVLDDADAAICYEPQWEKPLFIKGMALHMLGRQQESMRYFGYIARIQPSARFYLPDGLAFGNAGVKSIVGVQPLTDLAPAPNELDLAKAMTSLPPGWVYRESRSNPGRIYFECASSGMRQWEHPGDTEERNGAIDAPRY